jgi:hypothetical protein
MNDDDRPRKDNRIRLDPDVDRALDYYIAEQMVDLKEIKGVRLDRNAVVSDQMKEFLKVQGHYPPSKGGENESD